MLPTSVPGPLVPPARAAHPGPGAGRLRRRGATVTQWVVNVTLIVSTMAACFGGGWKWRGAVLAEGGAVIVPVKENQGRLDQIGLLEAANNRLVFQNAAAFDGLVAIEELAADLEERLDGLETRIRTLEAEGEVERSDAARKVWRSVGELAEGLGELEDQARNTQTQMESARMVGGQVTDTETVPTSSD